MDAACSCWLAVERAQVLSGRVPTADNQAGELIGPPAELGCRAALAAASRMPIMTANGFSSGT